jgi:hypothetical protein
MTGRAERYSPNGTLSSPANACIGTLNTAAAPVTAANANSTNNANFMEYTLPKPFVRDRQFPTFWGPLRVACLGFAQGVARQHHGQRSSDHCRTAGLSFFVRHICKTATNFCLTRAMIAIDLGWRAYDETS